VTYRERDAPTEKNNGEEPVHAHAESLRPGPKLRVASAPG
jgi:hypothetical protein